jgi:hypothetical protein
MAEISDLTRTVRTKVHACGCGCWVWTGAHDSSGYATMKMKGRQRIVHRYAFERLIGPIPPDMTIDHLCDRHRDCINPDHMEVVSRSVNSTRANERRWHSDTADASDCTHHNNNHKETSK